MGAIGTSVLVRIPACAACHGTGNTKREKREKMPCTKDVCRTCKGTAKWNNNLLSSKFKWPKQIVYSGVVRGHHSLGYIIQLDGEEEIRKCRYNDFVQLMDRSPAQN